MSRILTILFAVALAACTEEPDSDEPDASPTDVAADTNGPADTDASDPSDPDVSDGDVFPEPPLELTVDLCDDPSNMALLMDALGSDGEGPTYGQVNVAQVQRMVGSPTTGPFYMVNLIRYRDQAVYADGRDTELTGREANALYAPTEFLSAIGARVVFIGQVTGTTFGEEGEWDEVAIVEYPCPLALFAMSSHPEFQARSVHQNAGVEASTVMVTHLAPLGEFETGEPPFPPTADQSSIERVEIFRLRDEAQYDDVRDERTGLEAMGVYASEVRDAENRQGVRPTARLAVEGVFIGDGRDWDAVWIDFVPSLAALDALGEDPQAQAARVHYSAAIEDGAGMIVSPILSDIPAAPQVGFELLEVRSPSEIIVWIGLGMTRAAFDAIEVPEGWRKNEPREAEPDGGSFARSPDADEDGQFTDEEHFGHLFRHNATVIETNRSLDDEGLLAGFVVAKFHELRFDAGRTLSVLESPEGERYVLVSRDQDRTVEDPTIPDEWTLFDIEIDEAITLELPNPTLNIRCDNQDSFQGPVELPLD